MSLRHRARKTEAFLPVVASALNVLNGAQWLNIPVMVSLACPEIFEGSNHWNGFRDFLEIPFLLEKPAAKLLNDAFYARFRCQIKMLLGQTPARIIYGPTAKPLSHVYLANLY